MEAQTNIEMVALTNRVRHLTFSSSLFTNPPVNLDTLLTREETKKPKL